MSRLVPKVIHLALAIITPHLEGEGWLNSLDIRAGGLWTGFLRPSWPHGRWQSMVGSTSSISRQRPIAMQFFPALSPRRLFLPSPLPTAGSLMILGSPWVVACMRQPIWGLKSGIKGFPSPAFEALPEVLAGLPSPIVGFPIIHSSRLTLHI